MDILKQKIYLVILQFTIEITLLSCQTNVTGGSSSTILLTHRRQFPDRFGKKTKEPRVTKRRSVPVRETYEDECDYIKNYCHKTYATGLLCGRTIFYNYYTFSSFCMLEYVNCKEKYEVWQVAHMGFCYKLKTITEYIHTEYHNDSFLDTDYVIDDQNWDW